MSSTNIIPNDIKLYNAVPIAENNVAIERIKEKCIDCLIIIATLPDLHSAIEKVLIENEIRGVIDNGCYIMLGTYKTKERALEVLDEIQNLLIGYIL